MRRVSVALTLLVTCALALVGCGGGSGPAQQLASSLAAALQKAAAPGGATSAFAGVSFDGIQPTAVAKEYAQVVSGMDGIAPTVSVGSVGSGGSKEIAHLHWSWPLVAGHAPWSYDSQAELVEHGSTWSVSWARSIVQPKLGAHDVLNALTVPGRRGDITGAGGRTLVTLRPVVHVGIDRSRTSLADAVSSARSLAQLVGIDASAYVKEVRAAGDKAFVEAITFRRGDVPAAVSRSSLPGLLTMAGRLPLAPTKEFAAPILGRVGPVTADQMKKNPSLRIGDEVGQSGLQARYDDRLRGTSGRIVRAETPGSTVTPRTLARVGAKPGSPLRLTLDERLQTKAESLLSAVGPASALVAIRPSDGSILAAANGPGTDGQNYATYGEFAPGSTFKIITSLALLRAGLTPNTSVTCPTTTSVDGKQFKNDSEFPPSAIGTIPLREALAQSCNTAFIGQRGKIRKGQLAKAAATLGFGVDHDLGFPAYFGQVPAAASETEGAADMIGQGRILASPMAIATEMASVVAGHTVVPHMVDGVKTSVPSGVAPLTGSEARQLRTMLRGVVTTGTGRGLLGLPGKPVIAKTGTAEFDAGHGTTQTHAWMVAGQGDLAVAVFVNVGHTGAETAGPILADFLRAAHG
ncbi:MAG: penicillin-binding transpeptidase domain-containing protein [Nocardioidaceae bacterium]|nr:penicillin-binding transpeptidase domain-containing protein [Nocardioidaceae bacterium]